MVVSNIFSYIFYVHPYLGKIPNVHSYFSDGLKPPTITRINRVPLAATPQNEKAEPPPIDAWMVIDDG